MIYVITFIAVTIIQALCLYAGIKLTKLHGTFLGMLLVAAACSIVSYIPFVGGIASIVLMGYLLYKLTNADRIWPDIILSVVVARFFGYIAAFGIVYAFDKIF
ncbi:MAG: hypothetical protein GY750_01930 [Lentisphaerae bacterium]|nr:hypothetical protein [Lentisphaerota bacterium]MCP4100180.1 hypothetical protein [Lentisphaerota bacterium]